MGIFSQYPKPPSNIPTAIPMNYRFPSDIVMGQYPRLLRYQELWEEQMEWYHDFDITINEENWQRGFCFETLLEEGDFFASENLHDWKDLPDSYRIMTLAYGSRFYGWKNMIYFIRNQECGHKIQGMDLDAILEFLFGENS